MEKETQEVKTAEKTMAEKIQEALTGMSDIDTELYQKSAVKLTNVGVDTSEFMPLQVIKLAKSFCQVENENSIEAKQTESKKLENDFILKNRTSFENMAERIFDLVSSEIGDSPTKSYSTTVDTDKGSVIVGITAYQADTPERAERSTAKQEIAGYLKAIIENHGLRKLEKMLKVKRGTKERFTFGVFDEKVKIRGFDETPDLEFQMTLGYNSKLPKTITDKNDPDYEA